MYKANSSRLTLSQTIFRGFPLHSKKSTHIFRVDAIARIADSDSVAATPMDWRRKIVSYSRMLFSNSDSNSINRNRILPAIFIRFRIFVNPNLFSRLEDYRLCCRAVRSVLIADPNISKPNPVGIEYFQSGP